MYKTPERKAFDKELGAALKRARIAAGLTRNDVSIDTGLNPSSIDRIERGESSTNTFDVLRIINVLGVDPAALFLEIADIQWARIMNENTGR